MPVTLRTTLPDIFMDLLANLEEVVYQNFSKYPSVIPTIFKMKDPGNKPFVNITGVTDLPMLRERQESESVQYVNPEQGFDKEFTFLLYSLGVKIGMLAADDQDFDLVQEMGISLGNSAFTTKETNAALTFNRAWTAAYTGPDGKVFMATDHPLVQSGGTSANTLTAAALSHAALELLLDVFEGQLSDAGNKINKKAKFLLVPAKLQWQANRILDSDKQSSDASNATNVLKGYLQPVVWRYLTDDTAYFVGSDPSEHQLRYYDRMPFKLAHGEDFDTGGTKTRGDMRDDSGFSDWRGWAGNNSTHS